MLRITGAIMIIFAGSMLGFLKADKLFRRSKLLGKMITGLNLLKTDIGYGKKDLRNAISVIGENHGIEIFSKTAENMVTKGIRTALFDAVTELGEDLKESDKEPIFALGENLGMTDSQSQVNTISATTSVLELAKQEADEEYKRLGRMYRSVGVLGGVLGAIIFI